MILLMFVLLVEVVCDCMFVGELCVEDNVFNICTVCSSKDVVCYLEWMDGIIRGLGGAEFIVYFVLVSFNKLMGGWFCSVWSPKGSFNVEFDGIFWVDI